MHQKLKYAKLKAVDYQRAFKDGKTPASGNPLESAGNDPSDAIDGSNNTSDYQQSFESQQNGSSQPDLGINTTIINQLPKTPEVPRAAAKKFPTIDFDEPLPDDYLRFVEPVGANPQLVTAAEKHAKFAISALLFDDIPSAIKNLEDALKVLSPYRK